MLCVGNKISDTKLVQRVITNRRFSFRERFPSKYRILVNNILFKNLLLFADNTIINHKTMFIVNAKLDTITREMQDLLTVKAAGVVCIKCNDDFTRSYVHSLIKMS